MKKSLLAVLLVLSAGGAWAQSAQPAPAAPKASTADAQGAKETKERGVLAGLDVTAERKRIAAERKLVEDHFKQEETACYQKFAVNDCIEASSAVRREKLSDLRRQEILLNDAERKRKGAEQLRRMEEKEKTEVPPKALQKQERAKPQARHPEALQGDSADPKPRQPLSARGSPRTPHEPAARDPAVTEAQAAQERERYQRKVDDAAAHKADTLRRNAERTKPPAQPLPPAS